VRSVSPVSITFSFSYYLFCFKTTEIRADMPSLQTILRLRKYHGPEEEHMPEEADDDQSHPYIHVCMKLLPCIVGKVRWKADGRIQGGDLSKIATVSDETLMLIALENYYETWVSHPATATTKQHPTRYTVEGHGKDATKNGGWNVAGRRRYNELFSKVKEDRLRDETNGKRFSAAFISEYIKKGGEKKDNRKRLREDQEVVEESSAADDL
jgi:hypothetical protein